MHEIKLGDTLSSKHSSIQPYACGEPTKQNKQISHFTFNTPPSEPRVCFFN